VSLITVECVPRGCLWVALIELTIRYISPGELTYLIIALSSQVEEMIDFIACIDETSIGPMSPPSRD